MSGEKKHLLYEAVLEMVGEGTDPALIKISEVAERAGIGKGTVYEYFESKDQLIRNAHQYAIESMIRSVAQSVDQSDGFRGKIYAFLHELNRQSEKNMVMLDKLMQARQQPGANERFKKAVFPLFTNLREVFASLIRQGVSEGVIGQGHTMLETESAAICMVMTLLIYKKNPSDYGSYTLDEVIGLAYSNFIRLLS